MQFPWSHKAVAERHGFNPLPYVVGTLAVLGAGAYIAFNAATGSKPVTVDYPSNPPAATAAPTYAAPTVQAPAAAGPKGYLETSDGLARIEFPGLTEADARPYLERIHEQAKAEKKPFNGVVADVYKYVDGQLVKQDGKQLLRAKKDGSVLIELQCPPCDANTLEDLTTKATDDYNSILESLNPSIKPEIYVTVSTDGQKFNITYVLDKNQLHTIRTSQTAFYPWVTTLEESFDQMKYEMTLAFNHVIGYTDEPFLSEFWGHRTTKRNKPNLGLNSKDKLDFSYSASIRDSFEQVKLGRDIYFALVLEGFSDSDFIKLAQKLEGKKAGWEQLKTEAETIAGRRLPTLDHIDEGISFWGESR